MRRAKKREQLRKDLEITEEEEKEIYNYIQEEERKGSSKSFNLTGKKSPTSIGGAMNCPIVF